MWFNFCAKFIFFILLIENISLSFCFGPMGFSFIAQNAPQTKIPKQRHYFEKVSSVYSSKNGRKYMEDNFIRLQSYGVFGVFDGHGGSYASINARNTFNELITSYIQWFNKSPMIKKTFEMDIGNLLPIFIRALEAQLKADYMKRLHRTGTTCVIVIAAKDALYTVNVGDSRAVLSNINGSVARYTFDHKASNDNELKRILAAGGFVNDRGYINGHLQVSRSLGDFQYKFAKHGSAFIARPSRFMWEYSKYCPKFLILASDGLWDLVPLNEAIQLVNSWYKTEKDFGAKFLAETAIRRLSKDNITVMIVVFRNGYYEIGRN